MKLLAIDTSSAVLSVAACNGEKVAERLETTPRQHAEMIFELCDQVLAECGLSLTELDAITCGVGPGSFTSLRIGLGVAQGLAFGAGLPVISISSLLAVAQGAMPVTVNTALVCMDARMGEVYSAICQRDSNGRMQLHEEERVCAPVAVDFPAGEFIALGNGFTEYADSFSRHPEYLLSDCWPQASAVLELAKPQLAAGNTITPDLLLPKYVRNKVAHKSKAK